MASLYGFNLSVEFYNFWFRHSPLVCIDVIVVPMYPLP